MSFNLETVASRFSLLLAQKPQTLIFDEADPDDPTDGDGYVGTRMVMGQEVRYGDFGSNQGYSFSWVGAKADFTILPKKGDVVSVDGTQFRVLRSERDSADVAVKLDLGDKYGD